MRVSMRSTTQISILLIVLIGLSLSNLYLRTANANSGVFYVNINSSGTTHDGKSWATAFTSLQPALTNAVSGDSIWVAQGIYKPTQGVGRAATFILKSGVSLYGGFTGTETLLSQRNWTTNFTVLSGDLDGNDTTDSHGIDTSAANIVGNNAYNVVTASGLSNNTVIDGFFITGGSANGTSFPNNVGGGLYNASSDILTLNDDNFSGNQTSFYGGGMYTNLNTTTSLTNVTFTGNAAVDGGGGLANYGSPTLNHVTFSSNQAFWGGGMYNDHAAGPSLVNVILSDNTASWGGGMYNNLSDPSLTHVTLSSNLTTVGSGGGMDNESSNPTIAYTDFIGNHSGSQGGGVYNYNSHPTLSDTIFNGNSAFNAGGGIVNDSSSNAILTNVILTSNTTTGNGGGVYNNTSNPILTRVTISANSANHGGAIYNNANSNPQLINVILSGNYANQGGGIYSHASSPSLNNVTLSGNYAYTNGGFLGQGGGLFNDGGSNPSLVNCILWGDNAGDSGPEFYNTDGTSTVTITYSDVQGASVYTGAGNILANPAFITPVAATAAPTVTGNYRLQPTSPAINAGSNASVTTTTDRDGNPRIIGSKVDEGAYEWADRVYVPWVKK